MATFTLNGQFLTAVQDRQRKALAAAGEAYLGQMAQTLANTPPRHGRAYQWFKGHLSAMTGTRFFTRGGKVIPMEEPKGGWKLRGRVHIASAPGEPPALLTGDLRRRRGSRIGVGSGTDLVMQFGSSTPYAHRLEDGGTDKRGVTIAARPAWKPTMVASFPVIAQVFAARFRRG